MTNPVTPNNLYSVANGTTSSSVFVDKFMPRNPTEYDFNYQIQQKWLNTVDGSYWILQGFIPTSDALLANWIEIGPSSGEFETLTGNTGGPIEPVTGNIDVIGTGSITTAGTSGTITVKLTGLTDHNVLVGAGTPTVTSVAPSATSGVPLISQGSGSDPEFGTAVVAGGGTGATNFTAYSVITAGTTGTGHFQNVSGVGSSAQVLTSNGAGMLPTWQSLPSNTFDSLNIQTFTMSGTYTPTSGMQYCIIEVVGGGGGAGGCAATRSGTSSATSGGGGGGYARGLFTAAEVGVSQSVTVGSGGTGGTGNNAGVTGGTSSVGSLISASGGVGSTGNPASAQGSSAGGVGGTGSGGNIQVQGQEGDDCLWFVAIFSEFGGRGGDSSYGFGGSSTIGGTAQSTPGGNASAYGGGGGGAINGTSQSAQSGGNGSQGVVIITEYIH